MTRIIGFILSLFFVILATSLQTAHATTFTAIRSGDWSDNSTWGQNPPVIIQQNDIVIIPIGISVSSSNPFDNSIAVENSGTINLLGSWSNNGVVRITQDGILNNKGSFENYFGQLQNSGIINNFNKGIMNNYYATINNVEGVINNNGSIYNRNVINNSGNPPDRNATISNQGTILNEGSMNNDDGIIINSRTGIILNNNLGRPISEPQGTINNYGTTFNNYGKLVNGVNAVIQNVDTIINYCNGIVENSGTITIHDITSIPCDTIPPSITAPADILTVSKIPLIISLGIPIVSDNTDPAPTITNNSTGLFPIGITKIIWTATDHSDNVGTAIQTITIQTPVQAIDSLISLANYAGIEAASIKNISKLLDDNNSNNDIAACGKLNAFINKINADTKITQSQKQQLMHQDDLIRSVIGC